MAKPGLRAERHHVLVVSLAKREERLFYLGFMVMVPS